MAVRVFCGSPKELLDQVKAAIRDGSVETWQLDDDGDFTHTPQQWKYEAWFRPVVLNDRLLFNILGQTQKRMSTEVYAVYHGRFIEMLLAHFDDRFSRATATAQPEEGDYVGEEP